MIINQDESLSGIAKVSIPAGKHTLTLAILYNKGKNLENLTFGDFLHALLAGDKRKTFSYSPRGIHHTFHVTEQTIAHSDLANTPF